MGLTTMLPKINNLNLHLSLIFSIEKSKVLRVLLQLTGIPMRIQFTPKELFKILEPSTTNSWRLNLMLKPLSEELELDLKHSNPSMLQLLITNCSGTSITRCISQIETMENIGDISKV